MRFATPIQYDWDEWSESSALIVSMGLALAIAGIVQTLATVGFVAAVRVTPTIESPSSATEQTATPETGAGTASSSDSHREPTPTRSTGPAIAASEPLQSTTPSTPAPPEPTTPSRPATPAEPAESVSAPTARSSLEPRVDTVAAAPSTAEAVLEILRDTRARTTLAVLYHERSGNPQSVDELARAVADHTNECVEATATALRQSTLPQLRTV